MRDATRHPESSHPMNPKNPLVRPALARRAFWSALSLGVLLSACSSSSGGSDAPEYRIVTTSGAPLQGVAGDALPLEVVTVAADGSTHDLPAGASVVWTSPDPVTTLPPESDAPSPLPVAGNQPTAAWIDNTSRPDRAGDLAGFVFLLDPGIEQNGTVRVSATVSGAVPRVTVTASIEVDPTPLGDWTRGAALYGPDGANCAECHGPSGHGSPGAPSATTYVMANATYEFPAPGLNAEPGNAASDPDYTAALFAVAARADIDDGGVAQRLPMPDWLTRANPATGQPLSTQDLADMFAFLKTQTN
jgi:mono/diheme cytochrome c family protein